MIEIIPAIDIIDGKCVRLSQGDFSRKTIYNENPVEVAKEFENAGIKRLHLVDLDGAKNGKIVNLLILEKITSQTKLIIDFGGGIKTDEDVQSVYNAGADIITLGSIAYYEPKKVFEWQAKYGAEKILIGADVKDNMISVNGWQDETNVTIFDFLEPYISKGIHNFFCTDIAKDGLLDGASVKLYTELIKSFKDINLIASGGVSKLDDIEDLQRIGCSGVIIGKALYEGNIALKDLKKYLN